MTDPQELAEAQTKKGTFSFADAIRGLNYPQKPVTVYLNEQLGLELIGLREQRDGNPQKKLLPVLDPQELARIDAEIKRVEDELQNYKYTILLQGISEERRDELNDLAIESYPIDYDEQVNALTMQKVKVPLENEDRDTLYNNLLWKESFVTVTDPHGNEADDLSLDVIAEFRKRAPLAAKLAINIGLADVRMASNWYEGITSADF